MISSPSAAAGERGRLLACGLGLLVVVGALWLWPTGDAQPTPARSGSTSPAASHAELVDGGAAVAPAASEERTEEVVEGTRIRVLRAIDGEPVAAKLLFLSRWGKPLDGCVTDAGGEFHLPDTRQRGPHGVVAFHPRHGLRGAVLRGSEVVIQLPELAHIRVEVAVKHAVTRELLEMCERTVQLSHERRGNPVKAGPEFLEAKAFRHWNLHEYSVPMAGLRVDLPRYIQGAAKVRFTAVPTGPTRVVRWPPSGSGVTLRQPLHGPQISANQKLTAAQSTVQLKIHESSHALIAHFPRRAGEGAPHLALATERGRGLFGYPVCSDQAGIATFRIYGLGRGKHRPTIVHFDADGKGRPLECQLIDVQGRTEVQLQPRRHADLTIVLRGDLGGEATSFTRTVPVREKFRTGTTSLRVPGHKVVPCDPKATEVVLFDAEMRRLAVPFCKTDSGRRFVFENLPPRRYRVLVRRPDRVTDVVEVDLTNGASRQVTVDLHRVCRVDCQIPEKAGFYVSTVRARNVATGATRVAFRGRSNLREAGDRVVGEHFLLDLPYGTYELEADVRGGTWRRRVVLDAPMQTFDVRRPAKAR